MSNKPSEEIQESFLAPTTELIRRVELYEFDGTTPYLQPLWPEMLVGGTVSADQSRDERRSLDLELNNDSGFLNPEEGGFWYDKVIKVYLGIRISQEDREPRVMIVEEYESTGQAIALKQLLSEAGLSVVHYNPQVETYADVKDFDILVSISSTYTRKLGLLTEAYMHGKSILTFGLDATTAQLPYIIGSSASALSVHSGQRSFEKTELVDPVMVGWDDWIIDGPQSYRKINVPAAGTQVVANTWDETNGFSPGVIMRSDINGNKWIHVLQNDFTTSRFDDSEGTFEFVGFLDKITERLDYYAPQEIWETQMGEFVMDEGGDADSANDRISIVARDYTARCIGSKLAKATAFGKNEPIESVIKILAVNSSIFKFNLPVTGKTLGKDMTWERDTTRWSIMKEIATANNYEIYFDAFGYLRLEPQQDPVLTPPSLVLRTGIGGNLVSRSKKTSGGNIFNYVTVVGESSDTTVPLVYGEAKNESPNSPTNIKRLGERTKNISSPLVTTSEQARELAETMLSVSALEEFQLEFGAVLFPWIEPGEILEMPADSDKSWGPARYLISSLTLPLDLGPMSGSAKRIMKVN